MGMIGILKNKFRMIMKYSEYKRNNIIIAYNASIDNKTVLKGYNYIHKNCLISNSVIGQGTYIHDRSIIKNTKIGNWSSIGHDVSIIVGNHPTHVYVSTHPLFYSSKRFCNLKFRNKTNFEEYSFADNEKKFYCIIENDVWIGAKVSIIGGVTIGNGAIVAAGSLVNRDVPPYSIVAGVPAKVIGYRFTEKQIAMLEKIKWWNKDIEWLKNNSKNFDSINDFLLKYYNNL